MQLTHPALDCLRSFFSEMKIWEITIRREYDRVISDGLSENELVRIDKIGRESLEKIFAKYCDKGTGAERLQDQGLSFASEPSYDPDRDPILTVVEKDSKVVVEVQEAIGIRLQYQYELISRDGAWLIRDNKKRRLNVDGKWKPDIL